MASYLEGTASAPNAMDAVFQALRTHLTNNSWTEHDVITNTQNARNVVFRGAALDATADVRPFVQMQMTSALIIGFTGYADYDTGTHTGIASCGGNANAGINLGTDYSSPYVFRFDSMGGVIAVRNAGSWNRAYIGFLYRGLDSDEAGITKATTSLAIGATSISVASDMTTKLRVGQKVMVMNYAHSSASANASNAEAVTLSSVAAGSLGVSALTKNYDSGAVIGENVCPLVISNAGTSAGTLGAATYYLPYNVDGTRTSITGQTAQLTAQTVVRANDARPTDVTVRYGTGLLTFSENTAGKLDMKGYPRGGVFPVDGAGAGGPAAEDLLYDASGRTYILLDPNSSFMTAVGPRET